MSGSNDCLKVRLNRASFENHAAESSCSTHLPLHKRPFLSSEHGDTWQVFQALLHPHHLPSHSHHVLLLIMLFLKVFRVSNQSFQGQEVTVLHLEQQCLRVLSTGVPLLLNSLPAAFAAFPFSGHNLQSSTLELDPVKHKPKPETLLHCSALVPQVLSPGALCSV